MEKLVTRRSVSPQTSIHLREVHRLAFGTLFAETNCIFVPLPLCNSRTRIFFLFRQTDLDSFLHSASHIRHVPLWLAQLFKSYEMSNVTGWESNDSSPHPPINTPLHPMHLSSVNARRRAKIAGAPGCALIVHRVHVTQRCKRIVEIGLNMANANFHYSLVKPSMGNIFPFISYAFSLPSFSKWLDIYCTNGT